MSVSFRNPKVIQYFMKLCNNAPKTTVDWEKFRELDKRGVFNSMNNAQLSMRFRTYNLKSKGTCYYCGKNKATKDNGFCDICSEYVKKINSTYNHNTRKVKADNDK